MKILLIDVNCKKGSTGKIVYDLYTQINNNGDKAAICYGRGKKINENNIFKFGLDFETYCHAFLTRLTGYTGGFSFFSTIRLIKWIKKFNPDVVHIHELHAYFVNYGKLLNYLKKRNIKTILTLHCEFMYTGKCGYSFDCEKWKEECKNCPRVQAYPKSLYFDQTKKMFKAKRECFSNFDNLSIVTPSIWLAERCKLSFLKNKPISVIHNGIDTSVFYPRDTANLKTSLQISRSCKIILAVAPDLMSEIKGGEYVLKLAEKFIKKDVVFVLIGVKGELIDAPQNVINVGSIGNQDLLAEFYSLADAFVICSKRENFPTTCIEAQCCGTQIIGFDVGGVKETVISDSKNIVSYGNTDELANIIENLPHKDKEISRNLAEIAHKEYCPQRMFDEYYSLYSKN